MKAKKERIIFDHESSPDGKKSIDRAVRNEKLLKYFSLFIGIAVSLTLFIFSLSLAASF